MTIVYSDMDICPETSLLFGYASQWNSTRVWITHPATVADVLHEPGLDDKWRLVTVRQDGGFQSWSHRSGLGDVWQALQAPDVLACVTDGLGHTADIPLIEPKWHAEMRFTSTMQVDARLSVGPMHAAMALAAHHPGTHVWACDVQYGSLPSKQFAVMPVASLDTLQQSLDPLDRHWYIVIPENTPTLLFLDLDVNQHQLMQHPHWKSCQDFDAIFDAMLLPFLRELICTAIRLYHAMDDDTLNGVLAAFSQGYALGLTASSQGNKGSWHVYFNVPVVFASVETDLALLMRHVCGVLTQWLGGNRVGLNDGLDTHRLLDVALPWIQLCDSPGKSILDMSLYTKNHSFRVLGQIKQGCQDPQRTLRPLGDDTVSLVDSVPCAASGQQTIACLGSQTPIVLRARDFQATTTFYPGQLHPRSALGTILCPSRQAKKRKHLAWKSTPNENLQFFMGDWTLPAYLEARKSHDGHLYDHLIIDPQAHRRCFAVVSPNHHTQAQHLLQAMRPNATLWQSSLPSKQILLVLDWWLDANGHRAVLQCLSDAGIHVHHVDCLPLPGAIDSRSDSMYKEDVSIRVCEWTETHRPPTQLDDLPFDMAPPKEQVQVPTSYQGMLERTCALVQLDRAIIRPLQYGVVVHDPAQTRCPVGTCSHRKPGKISYVVSWGRTTARCWKCGSTTLHGISPEDKKSRRRWVRSVLGKRPSWQSMARQHMQGTTTEMADFVCEHLETECRDIVTALDNQSWSNANLVLMANTPDVWLLFHSNGSRRALINVHDASTKISIQTRHGSSWVRQSQFASKAGPQEWKATPMHRARLLSAIWFNARVLPAHLPDKDDAHAHLHQLFGQLSVHIYTHVGRCTDSVVQEYVLEAIRSSRQRDKPILLVLMAPCGSGKSTIIKLIWKQFVYHRGESTPDAFVASSLHVACRRRAAKATQEDLEGTTLYLDGDRNVKSASQLRHANHPIISPESWPKVSDNPQPDWFCVDEIVSAQDKLLSETMNQHHANKGVFMHGMLKWLRGAPLSVLADADLNPIYAREWVSAYLADRTDEPDVHIIQVLPSKPRTAEPVIHRQPHSMHMRRMAVHAYNHAHPDDPIHTFSVLNQKRMAEQWAKWLPTLEGRPFPLRLHTADSTNLETPILTHINQLNQDSAASMPVMPYQHTDEECQRILAQAQGTDIQGIGDLVHWMITQCIVTTLSFIWAIFDAIFVHYTPQLCTARQLVQMIMRVRHVPADADPEAYLPTTIDIALFPRYDATTQQWGNQPGLYRLEEARQQRFQQHSTSSQPCSIHQSASMQLAAKLTQLMAKEEYRGIVHPIQSLTKQLRDTYHDVRFMDCPFPVPQTDISTDVRVFDTNWGNNDAINADGPDNPWMDTYVASLRLCSRRYTLPAAQAFRHAASVQDHLAGNQEKEMEMELVSILPILQLDQLDHDLKQYYINHKNDIHRKRQQLEIAYGDGEGTLRVKAFNPDASTVTCSQQEYKRAHKLVQCLDRLAECLREDDELLAEETERLQRRVDTDGTSTKATHHVYRNDPPGLQSTSWLNVTEARRVFTILGMDLGQPTAFEHNTQDDLLSCQRIQTLVHTCQESPSTWFQPLFPRSIDWDKETPANATKHVVKVLDVLGIPCKRTKGNRGQNDYAGRNYNYSLSIDPEEMTQHIHRAKTLLAQGKPPNVKKRRRR